MLDPFIEQLTISLIALVTVGLGGVIGLSWVKMHSLDRKFVNNKVKQYQELADEYKKEASRWRGKVGKNFQDMQVEGVFDTDDPSDLGEIAKMVLPNILAFLPPDIQNKAKGFLNNPELINMAIELYKKHPEEIRSILSKFIKKGSTGSDGSNKIGSYTEAEVQSFA